MFEVGDRVECIVDNPAENEHIFVGSLGTVCITGSRSVGVCWDEYVEGHTCHRTCEDDHGWFVDPSEIVLHQCRDDEPFCFDDRKFKELLGVK